MEFTELEKVAENEEMKFSLLLRNIYKYCVSFRLREFWVLFCFNL